MDDLTREAAPKPRPEPLPPSTPEQQKERRAALARNWLPPKHERQKPDEGGSRVA